MRSFSRSAATRCPRREQLDLGLLETDLARDAAPLELALPLRLVLIEPHALIGLRDLRLDLPELGPG